MSVKAILLFSHWKQVRAGLEKVIDSFTDAELTYSPYPGAWPVGRMMLHIAECEDYWLHAVVRRELPPDVSYPLAEYPDREAIKGALTRAHARTRAFLETLDVDDLESYYTTPRGETFTLRWIIWHVLEHEIHHRGELSLCLGLLGREGLDV